MRCLAAVYPQALSGDVAAVDKVLSIMARRARMLGLDAAYTLIGAGADDRGDAPRAVEVIGGDRHHIRRLEDRLRQLEGDPERARRVQ